MNNEAADRFAKIAGGWSKPWAACINAMQAGFARSERLRLWRACLLATAVTAATLALRIAMNGWLDGQPTLVVFIVPIMLSACVGGLRAGFLATGLSCLGASYCLLAPIYSFAIASEVERWQLFYFALTGVAICLINQTVRLVRITGRRSHEAEIERLNRLYAALSGVNQAIVRVPNRDELFRRVCHVLVEHGGFCMAWVGWHDPVAQVIEPVADCGDDTGYLRKIRVYGDERPEGRGPTGTAFRTGSPYVCNDMLKDAATLPWRGHAGHCGFRASAVFPIRLKGAVCGTLSVYSSEKGFFQDKEIALLREAAGDISFALDNLEREEARRQAEAIAQGEKLFSDAMIESMPGIVYFYDDQGRFLRWNRNFHVVSGYSVEEIARMHPLDFFAGTDQLTVQERIAKVFTLGGSAIEASFLSKDGRATSYFFTGRQVVFQGKACLVGVGIDISEQKRAQSALREAELRFHTLFDQTPVGVVVIDQATAMIVECNKQAARQLGYTVQEFSGLDISNIEAVETREETRRRIETVQIEGGIEFETQHRTKAGEIRDVLVSGRMLELAGRKVIHCVFLDMTQRKRAETALHELNTNLENEVTKRTAELQSALVRAEAADRIKSAFLATMSHELRTPLNSIIGFTGIVLMGRPGPLNAEQTKQLGMVRNSARHLLALINDVLDISKIEAGQFTVCAEPFDPRVSLEHAVATVQPLADKKSLTLTHVLAPELGEMVSDRRRVEQILLNLLNNAIKFTDRGSVTLTAERIANFQSSRDVAPCLAVRICVADTGIGIDSENLATLFQPFRQVDTGLARHAEGTGLGLAISRRLAALLGGEISVASEWSKGSVFTVTLPLQKPSPP